MSIKFKTLLKLIGLVCLALFVIQLLFDPLSYVINVRRIEQIRRELPAAKARWEARRIASYTVTVRGGVPMSCFALDAKLFVEQEKIVHALTRKRPFDETSPFVNPVTSVEWRGCEYQKLTASAMFERVEQLLPTIDPAYEELMVSFDDTWGIVTRYQRNAGYQHGLLSLGVGECCMGYEFSDFQPAKQ
jgi:hypothetical protein